ncbi:hypothetical protein E5Z46_18055 [Geobacillus kaustophilus NBRC 102445]|nr:hypothetical protein E5Z46_18055 [Geobacillus kaustophilus NBRC 102445]
MLVHREHLLGLFVSLLTFYRKGALFSIPFGFYWIINTPGLTLYNPTLYMFLAIWHSSRRVKYSSLVKPFSCCLIQKYIFSPPI